MAAACPTFAALLDLRFEERIERMRDADATVVFFESPHRIHATLRELEAQLGLEREVAVCRELTKLHEQTLRGTLIIVASEPHCGCHGPFFPARP